MVQAAGVDVSSVWYTLRYGLGQIGLLLATVGLWIGALDWTPFGRRFDRAAFRAINRLPTAPALDWAMWSITHLGSAWSGLAVLALAIMVHHYRFGLHAALAMLTLGIVIGVSKALTQRHRPYVQLTGVRVIGLRPVDLSYPSGHSSVAFCLATLLALGLPLAWPARIAVYLLASTVGYSRLHLGVHYPLDVLSGALLGTGWGIIWVSFLRR